MALILAACHLLLQWHKAEVNQIDLTLGNFSHHEQFFRYRSAVVDPLHPLPTLDSGCSGCAWPKETRQTGAAGISLGDYEQLDARVVSEQPAGPEWRQEGAVE